MVDVSGVTVKGRKPWDDGFEAWRHDSVVDYSEGGGIDPHVAVVLNWATTHFSVASNVNQSDPRIAKLIDTVKGHMVTLKLLQQTLNDVTNPNAIITSGPYGAMNVQQFGAWLDKVTVEIKDGGVVNGAQATPSSLDWNTATWKIEIDVNHQTVKDYEFKFANPHQAYTYLIGHELGHANAQSLRFIVENAGYGSTTEPMNAGLIEAFANTMGRQFIASGYPSNADIYTNTQSMGLGPLGGSVPTYSFVGSDGNDLIIGDAGPDLLVGGKGIDTVTFEAHGGAISASLAPPAIYSSSATVYASIENLVGSNYGDTLAGSDAANQLSGMGGSDSITGGLGADSITGGLGDDALQGNAGNDSIHGNQGNDALYGGQGDDTVLGGAGDDQIRGDLGNDYIAGDLGNDHLWGGGGADIFFFQVGSGVDKIYDFNRAEGDYIKVSGSYTLYQSGADTVVDFMNGSTITLVGAGNPWAIPAGWIGY